MYETNDNNPRYLVPENKASMVNDGNILEQVTKFTYLNRAHVSYQTLQELVLLLIN